MSNVLHGDEISSALSSPIFSELQQDAQDAVTMATSFTDFVSSSNGQLNGPGWEKVQAKNTEFAELLNERMTLANEFGEAIQEALQTCLDFLAKDPAVDSLDAADLQEITETRDAAQADRDFIAAHMYDTKTVYDTVTDPDTGQPKQVPREEPLYDVSACQAKIAELDEDIEYANKLIAKIGEMETVIAEAMAKLEDAYSKVSEFGSKVGSFVPCGRFHYDAKAPYTPLPTETTTPQRRVLYTTPNGITVYEGDTVETREDGTIRTITHADGSSTDYNADGTVDAECSADGTTRRYGSDGNLLMETKTDGSYTAYYPDGSVREVRTADGQTTQYAQGTYLIAADGTRTTIRDTGSRMVEYPDGTSATYRADGTLDQSWDNDGNMTFHDEQGRPTVTQHRGGNITTYYPDGSVHRTVINGQETEYMQGEYGSTHTVTNTEVRETGSRLVEYSDGTSATYRADGTLDQSWDGQGNMTFHDEQGRPTATQHRGGNVTTYYPDGSVHRTVINGQETEYMQGEYGSTHTVTNTEVRETGSRLVEYSDGTSAVYGSNGIITQSWDGQGNMTMYDEEGRPTTTQHPNGGYTTYYPDGSIRGARDISGTEYSFTQGENVRTVAPVSTTPLEYNETQSMPPNTVIDEDGYIVIRDDFGVILSRIQPEYTPVANGTDITYNDPSNGNQIIIHSPYGGTNS